ncbi:MAG: FAD:protein FMN transferase, partial [Candidatus Dormibacteraeota bacterium]|nr:FAD:protein FMN transferase [Candidatus Dormibacteraeota bacterium]
QGVLRICDGICRDSHGASDARHWAGGGRVDPSGVVKGWAVERAADILRNSGARNFAINVGGDVLARGRVSPGSPWRVAIRHPDRSDRVAAVILAEDLAVATSALTERGEHIVDPRTGRTPGGLLSMTVAGPNLTRADAFATAAFVMGVAGVSWVAAIPSFAAYAITDEGHVIVSSAMAPLLDRAHA